MQTQWWELVQPPGCWAWELFLKGQNKLEGAWVPDAVEVPCQLWSASVRSVAGERSSRLQSQCSQSTLDLVMAFTCCPSQSFFSYAYVYHRTLLVALEIQESLLLESDAFSLVGKERFEVKCYFTENISQMSLTKAGGSDAKRRMARWSDILLQGLVACCLLI